MRVFNVCMRILKRNAGLILMYNIMFIGIGFLAGTVYGEDFDSGFRTENYNYTIINRDENTVYAKGLSEYLSSCGTEVKTENKKEAISDALFYGETEAVISIPEGFSEAFLNGGEKELEMTFKPDSAVGYYVQSMVENYIRILKTCRLSGSKTAEAQVKQALPALLEEAHAEQRDYTDKTRPSTFFVRFITIEYYILTAVIILCVSGMEVPFKESNMRMRNKVSPLPARRFAWEKGLAAFLCTMIIWLLPNILLAAVEFPALLKMDFRMLLLLWFNSFTAAGTAMGLALLTAVYVRNFNIQNAAANIITLTLCFLGGIFVPLSMLGENVKKIAHFLPSYWYSDTVGKIVGLTEYQGAGIRQVWMGLLIQWGFTAAILSVALVLNRYRSRAEESYGSAQTELEA